MTPTCTCQQRPPVSYLYPVVADVTGATPPFRLPAGRWWCVLGAENGVGGYQVWLQWGDRKIRVDNVLNGLHATPMPCFPDAFVYLTNATPGLAYLIAVSE